MDTIPIIDIAPYRSGDTGAAQVVRAIDVACRDIGFFLATGHGVSPTVQAALYDEARRFFDQPDTVKRQARESGDQPGGLSFLPLAREALAGTVGIAGPGDYKASLNHGRALPGGAWPPGSEALHAAFDAYFAAMEALGGVLRAIFCEAIGLPGDYFEADFVDHLSALRVIDYPEQRTRPCAGQVRAGEHTDYGFLTILRSEASPGGLQVRDRAGTWIDVPAIEDAFVINIGDAFMRWTNGVWRSTAHRVVNPPTGISAGSRRQSIPFFMNPRADTWIACLAPFLGETGAPAYPPVTYGDYIALKTRQANA